MQRTILKEIVPVAAILFGIAVVILNYERLPDAVPIHFGLLGQPDGWGPRGSIAVLPVLSLVLYIVLSVGQNSKKFNIPWKLTESNRDALIAHCRRLIWAIKVHVLIVFSYLEWAAVQVAIGSMDTIGVWFGPVFLGGIFGLIAWFFVKGKKIAGSTSI